MHRRVICGWRAAQDPARVRKIAGIDVRKLDQAFAYASRTSQHGRLLVARHGWLVCERYYGQGHREAHPDMSSVGKAYCSIACGILLADKHDEIPPGLDQKFDYKKMEVKVIGRTMRLVEEGDGPIKEIL